MDKLSYTIQNYHADKDCVGLIVLQTDEVVEPEVRSWLPQDITLYHTRIPSQAVVTEQTLLKMQDQIPKVCALFPSHAPISVVAYCCTSGATLIGESVVEKSIQNIIPNAKVTNPLTAVKAYLNSIRAKKIGLLTPYIPSVSDAMLNHLEAHDFSIVSSASFFEEHERQVCRIASDAIEQAIEHVANAAQCDAIFASCTNLRTIDILDTLSKRIGIPVISSNAALAWHIQELSSIRQQ